MKKIFLTLILSVLFISAFGQDAHELFLKGHEAVKEEKLDEAISYFDQAIAMKSDEFIIWYNRAIVKSWQRRYEEAILDFDQAINLNPNHKKII